VNVTIEDDYDDGGGNCCTVEIPVSIGSEGDSFAVLTQRDERTLVKVSSSEGLVKIDPRDSSKHTLFFESKGYVGIATVTYYLSDGSSKTISIECYDD